MRSGMSAPTLAPVLMSLVMLLFLDQMLVGLRNPWSEHRAVFSPDSATATPVPTMKPPRPRSAGNPIYVAFMRVSFSVSRTGEGSLTIGVYDPGDGAVGSDIFVPYDQSSDETYSIVLAPELETKWTVHIDRLLQDRVKLVPPDAAQGEPLIDLLPSSTGGTIATVDSAGTDLRYEVDLDSLIRNRPALLLPGPDLLQGNGYRSGEQAADSMSDLIGGRGEVLILNNVPYQAGEDFVTGFNDSIERLGLDLSVIEVSGGQLSEEELVGTLEALREANPDITGVYIVDDGTSTDLSGDLMASVESQEGILLGIQPVPPGAEQTR